MCCAVTIDSVFPYHNQTCDICQYVYVGQLAPVIRVVLLSVVCASVRLYFKAEAALPAKCDEAEAQVTRLPFLISAAASAKVSLLDLLDSRTW